MAEELYQQVAKKPAKSIHLDTWPEWDEKLALKQQVSIPVQVNGKLRGEVVIAHDQLQKKELVLVAVKKLTAIQSRLEGKKLIKEIYVPGKIVNLVIK